MMSSSASSAQQGFFLLNQLKLYVHWSFLCSTSKREEWRTAGKGFWEAYIICFITTMTTALTSTIIIATALTTTIIILLQSSVH